MLLAKYIIRLEVPDPPEDEDESAMLAREAKDTEREDALYELCLGSTIERIAREQVETRTVLDDVVVRCDRDDWSE